MESVSQRGAFPDDARGSGFAEGFVAGQGDRDLGFAFDAGEEFAQDGTVFDSLRCALRPELMSVD